MPPDHPSRQLTASETYHLQEKCQDILGIEDNIELLYSTLVTNQHVNQQYQRNSNIYAVKVHLWVVVG